MRRPEVLFTRSDQNLGLTRIQVFDQQ